MDRFTVSPRSRREYRFAGTGWYRPMCRSRGSMRSIRQDVAFVKIDVEGHELNVLNGAVELLERSQPVFLVEAEDRHRAEATRSVFEFFRSKFYRGLLPGRRRCRSRPRSSDAGRDCRTPMPCSPDGGRKRWTILRQQFLTLFPGHLDGEVDTDELARGFIKLSSSNRRGAQGRPE